MTDKLFTHQLQRLCRIYFKRKRNRKAALWHSRVKQLQERVINERYKAISIIPEKPLRRTK